MAINAEQNQLDEAKKNDGSSPAQAPVTGGGAVSSPSGSTPGRVANYSTGNQSKGSSSGRFTNLQNYLDANQGAGSRLAQGINQNIDKSTEAGKKEANTQAENVRAGIEAANTKLGTGTDYLNQVQGSNFDANSIAKDQSKLNDFTQYRTNQAIDSTGLKNQLSTAQQAGISYQQDLQNKAQQAATEEGRFGLLKNTFAGGPASQNPYSTGQQRLDQLFLQSGGNNEIRNIQDTLRNRIGDAGNLVNQVDQYGNQITNANTGIVSQAQKLAGDLQSATSGLESKYVGDIAATEAAVNAQRQAEQDWANKQYQTLQNNSGKIDQRFANLFGLTGGQNIYNTLTGKNADHYLDFGTTNLTGANQLANQDQRNYYDSLAKLAGVETPNYQIRQDYTPEAAVSLDKVNNMQNDINATRAAFDSRNYTATGGGSYGSSLVNNISGLNLGRVIEQMGADKNNLQNNLYNNVWAQGAYMPSFSKDAQLDALLQAVANASTFGGANTGGIDPGSNYARGISTGNATKALKDLLESGYFHNISVADPTLESDNHFNIK